MDAEEKALWFARADQLGDRWEMAFSKAERAFLSTPPEQLEDMQRAIREERDSTFVNCWTASNSESHAMWNVYCDSSEGVAVQTTLRELKASVKPLPVVPVKYMNFDRLGVTNPVPTAMDLVSRKRKPYSYEKEHRVISFKGPFPKGSLGNLSGGYRLGFGQRWDPEIHVERVLLHPGADPATLVAVKAVVEKLAPKLRLRVLPSALAELPST